MPPFFWKHTLTHCLIFGVHYKKSHRFARKIQNKLYRAKVVGGTSRDQKSDVRDQKGKGQFQARMVGGKVSEDLFERGLCLPSGTAMTNGDLDRVIDTILNCRKKAQEAQK